MKKNTTKILMAALALFMAIGIATGTTFAWFALNNTVTATGMQVEVKSNTTFLLIGGSDTTTASAVQGQTGADRTTEDLTVLAADADVYPSAPALTAGEAAYLTTASGHKTTAGAAISTEGIQVTSNTTADDYTNWYTANALAVTASTIDTATVKQLATFADYVILKTVYLTVDVGANNAENLTITGKIAPSDIAAPVVDAKAAEGKTYYTYNSTTGVYTKVDSSSFVVGTTDVSAYYSSSKDITAVKVLVATDDGGFTVLDYTNNGTPVDISGSNTAITSTSVRRVDLYIYYDGTEDAVYTNNKANLGNATIDIEFGVTPVN